MADQFVAEIRMFPFTFAPNGWAFCNGQLLSISQNTALFSLLGTTYGGNGTSNFALPNLQGCASMHAGQGPGLSNHSLGETAGETAVTLTSGQLPAHGHSLQVSSSLAVYNTPDSQLSLGRSSDGMQAYSTDTSNLVAMNPNSTTVTGGSQPHNNLMPYLVINFCIALQGIFPPRS
ncbi:MAG: phage tail protein [Nevskia sp.]|nr:phage tail protein [Nevskia sp.]